MTAPGMDAAAALRAAVQEYERTDNVGVLFDRVRAVAAAVAPAGLKEACAPFRDLPEVIIPAYERIVAQVPDDAQALVVLANAYWLTGRGPDVVGDLASRAIAADADNRGAWHLWALAESDIRERVGRWQEVATRFPEDQLARAAMADNATSLASAEHDPLALDLAIRTYEGLLAESTAGAQRSALESTLKTLRGWKL
ncbi:MAG: hypothetical protein KGN74_07760 [Gemmatimonadota bacterium]|nr:hypothetical protein [Gemmatimonadota bacterium]MDE3172952.1 hypothetical protein [Gemmatimonadota bacterium]MDE3216659.1 hypothetical protein [Gemmatimonadota bacterium]